jgi:hypothetical protein
MADDHFDPSASLPPGGATAQELLQTMLPLVGKSAADSARAATAAASAMTALEAKQTSFEKTVQDNTAEVSRLADALEAVHKTRANNQAWLRTLFTPQTIAILLAIVLGLFGIRMSIPAPFSIALPAPAETVSPSP